MNEEIEGFPLQWPRGVPRTEPHNRIRGDFGKVGTQTYSSGNTYQTKQPMEFGSALRRLSDELRRVGARDFVVSTNMPTRGDGMPYAKARQPEDPGVAVYFVRGSLNKPQRVCLPCDKFKRIADNITAVAKHIEAMRGMERWGVGTAAQLYEGFKALPGKGETTVGSQGAPYWQVLGLSENATAAELKKRYYELAAKNHPDRGGNAGAMAAINRAWEQAQSAGVVA